MNLNSKQTFNLTLSINPELHTDTDSNPNLKYNPELTSTQPQTHNSTQNLTLTETGCTLNPKPNANILTHSHPSSRLKNNYKNLSPNAAYDFQFIPQPKQILILPQSYR